jgi:hypothetical protein
MIGPDSPATEELAVFRTFDHQGPIASVRPFPCSRLPVNLPNEINTVWAKGNKKLIVDALHALFG